MNIITTVNTETADPAEVVTQQVAKIANGDFGAALAGIKQFAIPLSVSNLPVPVVIVASDDIGTAVSWLTAAANLADDASLKAAIEAQL